MINETYKAMLSGKSIIRELSEYATKRGEKIGYDNVFDYSLGNPSVPCAEDYTKAIIDMHETMNPMELHGYSPSTTIPSVRKAVAESLNRRFGMQYGMEHIFMTSGAAGALAHALRAVTKPGDTVLTFAPFFPEYTPYVEGTGAKLEVVPAHTKDFQINFEAFEEMLTGDVMAVLINTPNNPSGIVYSEETIEHLADLLRQKEKAFGHEIFLISDEPYREIAFEGTVVPYLPKYYKNTLVCYSWSKSLSLPGERMGYVVVPDEVDEHELVYAAIAGAGRSLGYVNAPGLFQRVCALCASETSDISVYETNKNILTKGLRDMGYHVVEPGGTFYMFPRTLIDDDIAFCEKAKLDHNLLIVPGTGFGCPGHARISYCVPTEQVERSLAAFEKLVKSYK